MMDVKRPIDTTNEALRLLELLFSGEMETSDFRIEISDYSQTMVKNLFRDSFPKYNQNLKDRFTNAFVRYFYNDKDAPINEFWKFTNYKDFWVKMKNFHDNTYSRKMNLSEVVSFFERNLLSNNRKISLDFVEGKVIEKLDKNPNILNKDLADDLQISEKRISNIIGSLKSRGIYLGCFTDYSLLDAYEFFGFTEIDDSNEEIQFIESISLFPNFKLFHGLSLQEIKQPPVYHVVNKQIYCNTKVLNQGFSFQDWIKVQNSMKNPNKIVLEEDLDDFYVPSSSKSYVLQLMKNCEIDFRRPKIKEIAERNNVSIRTLFRIKSKLKDRGLIQPQIIIENDDLMSIFVISSRELLEFYNKVPFVRSYEVNNKNDDRKWFSFMSIFASDFKFIYSKLKNHSEVFQVIGKKAVKLVSQSNQKIYTN